MTLDGDNHTGSSLIYPASYHPGAPVVASVVKGALQASYVSAQYQSQFVGIQTYRQNMLNIDTYYSNFGFTEDAEHIIAQFPVVVAPHTTTFDVTVLFDIVGASGVSTADCYHRITISGVGISDVPGTQITKEATSSTNRPTRLRNTFKRNFGANFTGKRGVTEFYPKGYPNLWEGGLDSVTRVDLSESATAHVGTERWITVKAQADTTSVRYIPVLTICWQGFKNV